MSDINSTAATQATLSSPRTSFYGSPANSNSSDAATGPRSPSPPERDAKRRRRMDIWFPETTLPPQTESNTADVNPDHGLIHTLDSIPFVLDHSRQFELQPKTFLNEDREFMSHIISTRGVIGKTLKIAKTSDRLPGLCKVLEHLPVISTDKLCFIGWREKADTWPLDKACYGQRSFTFPN